MNLSSLAMAKQQTCAVKLGQITWLLKRGQRGKDPSAFFIGEAGNSVDIRSLRGSNPAGLESLTAPLPLS
jgi:hypothetical protein